MITEAILKINPNAKVVVRGSDIDTCQIEWLEGTSEISKADIKAQIPTVEQEIADEAQAKIDNKASANTKLKALGLTDAEIEALKKLMAYIGREPQIGNFQVCDAISTVNGQAAYTLQVGGVNVSPETVNNMICSVNGVIQQPGVSFDVAGSTITFTSNLVTGDVINFIQILGSVLDLGVPSDNTVTTAKIADGAVTAAKLASGVGGISEADMFRLTATITANVDPIAANLERVDNATFAKIGTGVTNSSGVFSFAATGLYMVTVRMTGQPTANDNVSIALYATANNGTAYDELFSNTFGADTNAVLSATNSAFFNCTNVSTHKVKFAAQSITSGSEISGNTNTNNTTFKFIRLGDSQ